LLFGENLQLSLTLAARETVKLFFESLAELSLPLGVVAAGFVITSLSMIVIVASCGSPRTAPSEGPESVSATVSLSSCAASSVIGMSTVS